MDYQCVKNRFAEYVSENQHVTLPPPGIRGAAIAVLEGACGGKENRYLITHALCGKVHTSEFTPGEWYALMRMVDPNKNPMSNKWEGRENLAQLCAVVLNELAAQAGQLLLVEQYQREDA